MALPQDYEFQIGQTFHRVFFSHDRYYLREVTVSATFPRKGCNTIHVDGRGRAVHDDCFSQVRATAEFHIDRKDAVREFSELNRIHLTREFNELDERREWVRTNLMKEGIPDEFEESIKALTKAGGDFSRLLAEYRAADEAYMRVALSYGPNYADDPQAKAFVKEAFDAMKASEHALHEATVARGLRYNEACTASGLTLTQRDRCFQIRRAFTTGREPDPDTV